MGFFDSPNFCSPKYSLKTFSFPFESYLGFVCKNEALSQNDLDMVSLRFSSLQNPRISLASISLAATHARFAEPALVPRKKSKIS